MKFIIGILVVVLSFIWTSFWADRFNNILNNSVENIRWQLDIAPVTDTPEWEWIKNYLIYIWQRIMIPVVIAIALIIVIIWFYNIFFTDKDEEHKKWVKYIVWWVIWILIMVSAGYIWRTMLGQSGWWWIINTFSGTTIAENLYSAIAYPFLKIAMFLVIWVLFFFLFIHSFKFITTPSDDIKKHSQKIIIWNVVWIILILSTKNIVEVIYGSVDQVAWNPWRTLGDIWTWILENKNFSALYGSINWIIWFAAFLTLLIILYQTFLLISKPDDAETSKKLKRNFVYIFVWVLIIWAWYLITNFFIVR